jgi:hypothetical protein
MKVTTKYVIEFCVDNTVEIIAVCNSLSEIKEYLAEKFIINYTMEANSQGYLLVIKLDYGALRVRKIDFVEE